MRIALPSRRELCILFAGTRQRPGLFPFWQRRIVLCLEWLGHRIQRYALFCCLTCWSCCWSCCCCCWFVACFFFIWILLPVAFTVSVTAAFEISLISCFAEFFTHTHTHTHTNIFFHRHKMCFHRRRICWKLKMPLWNCHQRCTLCKLWHTQGQLWAIHNRPHLPQPSQRRCVARPLRGWKLVPNVGQHACVW